MPYNNEKRFEKGAEMKKVAYIALGVIVGSMAVSLVVHRHVVAAMIKGEPMPEPPEWHKKWHPCFKNK